MEHKPVPSKLPRLTLAREGCIIRTHYPPGGRLRFAAQVAETAILAKFR